MRLLPHFVDQNVLVGTESPDDAAVYRLDDNTALVATVDFFTPIVDDAYSFGQIAAANSLSDIYAMGARPIFALNIVGFPRDKLPMSVLGDILRGGADKASEAGIAVVGGHSIDDGEPKYGMAVIGIAHPDKLITKGGARPGDRLVLTKPIGIGIIATAIKAEVASESITAEAVRVMTTLNRDASEVMRRFEIRSGTDVTGFGLLGHLSEMVRASGVGAKVDLESVPVIDGVFELAENEVIPGGTRRNHAHLEESVRYGSDIRLVDQLVLCDAQTSGGLLMSVSGDRVEALVEALRAAGTLAASVIGEVIEGEGIDVFRRQS